MNTNELIELLDEAAQRTGLDLVFHYGTISCDKRLFLAANYPGGAFASTYATDLEAVKTFLEELDPAPSKLEALKKQRDELQKQIDELGAETLICNGE